jgi:hypothetical protein
MPSFDVGQMVAEMYALWLYKSIVAGLWMLQGLVAAYRPPSQEFAFRAALQVGAHLICITTAFGNWGTPQQLEEVVRVGRDIVLHAWHKDRTWFEQGELACLFAEV